MEGLNLKNKNIKGGPFHYSTKNQKSISMDLSRITRVGSNFSGEMQYFSFHLHLFLINETCF